MLAPVRVRVWRLSRERRKEREEKSMLRGRSVRVMEETRESVQETPAKEVQRSPLEAQLEREWGGEGREFLKERSFCKSPVSKEEDGEEERRRRKTKKKGGRAMGGERLSVRGKKACRSPLTGGSREGED